MSLLTARASFVADLLDLWENERPDDHIPTCDLIEDYWSNARVSGMELAPPPSFAAGSLYTPMSVLSVPGGTALSAAGAIEGALASLCAATIFTVITPATVTPPPFPVPGGLATPGGLTSLLAGIFEAGAAGGSTASVVANAISGYLLGWQIVMTVPPASASPAPIL